MFRDLILIQLNHFKIGKKVKTNKNRKNKRIFNTIKFKMKNKRNYNKK